MGSFGGKCSAEKDKEKKQKGGEEGKEKSMLNNLIDLCQLIYMHVAQLLRIRTQPAFW